VTDPVTVLWTVLAWSAALVCAAWVVAQGLSALDALRRGEGGGDGADGGEGQGGA
jgi:hypothetical protein